jgi:long-chain acyl-CoA synthetase
MALGFSLRSAASRLPNKPALVVGDRSLDYAGFAREARTLALNLVAAGVNPGDRIALHRDNGAELAIAYYACFHAGAIAVPLNTRLKAPELEYQLAHSGASIYLGQADLFGEIDGIRSRLPGIRRFVVDERELEAAPERLAATRLPALAADQPAVILYTSGTTARPKGVVHTHGSLLRAAAGFSVARHDVVMIITSMMHSAALMLLVANVDAAATAVVVACFDPAVVLEALARHRGTYMIGMPVMYRALIAAQEERPRDVRSGQRLLAGGDAVPPALKGAFARSFRRPLYEGFGTTETGPVAVNWSGAADRLGSFGRAVPGVEIRVAGETGDPAAVGEGEMIVRSAGTMAGYWNDGAATEAAVRHGWYHTGDLIRRDAEGYLWFLGRKKEIIVRGGANISPSEVEAALYQHGDVRDAAVVGVPDAGWGERVVAFVSRQPRKTVTAHTLMAHLEERLHPNKIPEEILFLDDLPKSSAGKVLRRTLRAAYMAGSLALVATSRSSRQAKR